MMKRLSALLAIMAMAACGSSTSTTTTAAATDTSVTVPSDVVITSPTAASSAAANLSKSAGKAVVEAAGDDYLAKKEVLATLIAGEGDCSFTFEVPSVSDITCYGPVVNYSGHINGAGGTSLPPGDTGIWNATQGDAGEACAAAKMNELVSKIASKVDNIINMAGATACAGKKADVALPAVGESTDLATALTDNLVVDKIVVNTATLERLADDADGNEVFETTTDIDSTAQIGGQDATSSIVATVKHVPTNDTNSTYKGKISIKWSIPGVAQAQNCNAGSGTGQVDAGTILYEKTSATSVTYEVNWATFCGSGTDPFDADNNIDPSDKVSGTNLDGWSSNWNYALINYNPANGTGSVAYAWQAGYNDQRTRTFNVTVAQNDAGDATGTAYAGFGPDIATAEGRGSINGFICNWAGPNGATSAPGDDRSQSALTALSPARAVNLAQRQTLTRTSGDIVFSAATSNITYAPANACNATASDGFTFNAVSNPGNTALNYDNDRDDDTGAVTNNLIDLDDVDFTMPTAPTDL